MERRSFLSMLCFGVAAVSATKPANALIGAGRLTVSPDQPEAPEPAVAQPADMEQAKIEQAYHYGHWHNPYWRRHRRRYWRRSRRRYWRRRYYW